MRILLLAPESSPSIGGVGSYSYNLARSISDRHEVHILSVDRGAPDSLDRLLDGRCRIVYLGRARTSDTFLYTPRFQVKVGMALAKYCRENRIDIIHSHSGHSPQALGQLFTRTPIVTTVHATVRGLVQAIKLSASQTRADRLACVFAPLAAEAELMSLHRANLLMAISEFTRGEVARLYGHDFVKKAQVVGNAVDVELFTPTVDWPVDEVRVLNVGRSSGVKGLDRFLRAMKELQSTERNIVPLVAGSRHVDAALQDLACQSRARFVGNVPFRKLPELYSSCQLVVVTSLYENSPSVILEAMACGRAVLAPAIGGIPEIITNGITGMLYDPSNIKDLARNIRLALANPDSLREIGREARRQVVAGFSWKQRSDLISDLYAKTIAGGQRSAST